MTRPRILLGGAVLALLLGGYGVVLWYRSVAPPASVVITHPAPLDPPRGALAPAAAAAAPAPRRTAPAAATASPASHSSDPAEAAVAATIMVHVVGAVRKAGVYHLPAKARLADAVHAAGGPKAGADLEAVNLASFVQDGEQVRVPALSERRLMQPASAPAAPSPRPRRGALAPRPVRSIERYPLAAATTAAAPPPARAAAGEARAKGSSVVNLNTASAEELETIPGVGPKTAAAILAYRHEHGLFQRVEDLMEIRGIGEKKLARMREWVMVK